MAEIMFGYSKEKFEGWITRIKDEVAWVDIVDDDGKKSYMEIPVKVLKDKRIKTKPGVIFSMFFKSWFRWEWFVFSPIKQKHMPEEEFDALYKYYEDKYGDV